MLPLKTIGAAAYMIRPITLSRGMVLTAFEMLNLCEKNEKIRSTVSCVQKFINIRKPKREYDMPYKERNVIKSRGGKFPATDVEMLDVKHANFSFL